MSRRCATRSRAATESHLDAFVLCTRRDCEVGRCCREIVLRCGRQRVLQLDVALKVRADQISRDMYSKKISAWKTNPDDVDSCNVPLRKVLQDGFLQERQAGKSGTAKLRRYTEVQQRSTPRRLTQTAVDADPHGATEGPEEVVHEARALLNAGLTLSQRLSKKKQTSWKLMVKFAFFRAIDPTTEIGKPASTTYAAQPSKNRRKEDMFLLDSDDGEDENDALLQAATTCSEPTRAQHGTQNASSSTRMSLNSVKTVLSFSRHKDAK